MRGEPLVHIRQGTKSPHWIQSDMPYRSSSFNDIYSTLYIKHGCKMILIAIVGYHTVGFIDL
jgi:hypothetical protein